MTAMPSSKLNLNKTWPTIILGTALLLGLVIRLIPISHSQIFFWFDQGLDISLVKHLVIDHVVSLTGRYSGSQGVLMGPFWTWLLAIPFTLSGGSPLGSSVFFSLMSLLSSVLTYKILSRLLPKSSAVLTAVLTIFAPLYIFSSLVVSSPHPLTFLCIFYVWSLYEISINGKTKFWIFLGFLVGIFLQLEVAVGIFAVPPILLSLIIFRKIRLIFNRHFAFALIVLLLTLAPQFLFDIRHDFLISKGFADVLLGTSSSLNLGNDPLNVRLWERAKSFAEDFVRMALFVKPQILIWPTIFLAIFGWFRIFQKKLKNEINILKILLIILFSFYICFSFYRGPLWEWYRAALPIIYILLIAIPLGAIIHFHKFLRPPVILLITIFLISGINPSTLADSLNNKPINDNAILQNQLKAIDFVYNSASKKSFTYFAYTPPVYDYIWQHNFWWYGLKKYGYVPTNLGTNIPLLGIGTQSLPPNENQGLFYVIAEPNKERPWEVNGYFETYIKVGKVISTKQFPGGIIVQQRTTK